MISHRDYYTALSGQHPGRDCHQRQFVSGTSRHEPFLDFVSDINGWAANYNKNARKNGNKKVVIYL